MDKEDVLVRPPRAGDGDDLARCWLDAGAYYTDLAPALFQVPESEGLAEWLEQQVLRKGSDDEQVLVAQVGGRVLGYVGAVVERPVKDASKQLIRFLGQVRLTVNVLVVAEDDRRQGIGTRLMDAIEEWARGRGAVVALVDTYVESPLSMSFYESRMGYRRRAMLFEKALT